MSERLDYTHVVPDGFKAVLGLENYLQKCGLEYSLYELVKTRASQINGCAYCLHMHTKDARKAGEAELRLYLLSAWRESSLYSDRERTALAWTESLTEVAAKGAPANEFADLQEHFSDVEIANLTLLIGQINIWNRIAVGFSLAHPDD